MKFGKYLRCLDVGSVVFIGKCSAFGIRLLFSCAKGPSWYHSVWFGGWTLHWDIVYKTNCIWTHWRALGNMGFHLKNWMKDHNKTTVAYEGLVTVTWSPVTFLESLWPEQCEPLQWLILMSTKVWLAQVIRCDKVGCLWSCSLQMEVIFTIWIGLKDKHIYSSPCVSELGKMFLMSTIK